MRISPEEVEHVATLARLALDADKRQALARDMDRILGYVEQLQQLDTSDVAPLAHAVDVTNALAVDEPRPSLGTAAALQNAPASDEHCFTVPRVID